MYEHIHTGTLPIFIFVKVERQVHIGHNICNNIK